MKIASISRFRSKKEQDSIVEEIKSGKVDIVIGTHRLLSKDIEFTDESSAIKNIGEDIFYIKGDIASKKLTFFEDISQITCLKAPAKTQFVGIGYDIHSFEDKKERFLGGVKLPYD